MKQEKSEKSRVDFSSEEAKRKLFRKEEREKLKTHIDRWVHEDVKADCTARLYISGDLKKIMVEVTIDDDQSEHSCPECRN